MKKFIVIFSIFYLLFVRNTSFAQSDSISDWQEQVLLRIDADEFSESYYSRLMEMLGDLELSRRDTAFLQKVRQDIIIRTDRCLNIREGFHSVTPEKISQGKAYRGDAWNQTVRYKLQVGNDWRAGFVLNKDAGERFRHRFPMYDSYSCYVAYRNTIIGHYRVRLGSGLILNQQFSLGKNILSDAFMSSGTRLSPHSSTDEYNYMQGAATDLRLGRFRILPFVSFKEIDAAVKGDTITSIPTDGMHRTKNEAGKRHTATVINAGLHAGIRGKSYEAGVNLLYSRFSIPFSRPLRAYNINYYRGQQLMQGSLDFHARLRGFELRGETAFDQDMNLASIAQVTHNLGEDWRAALLLRHFGDRYQQLYASTVSEGSSMQGEDGASITISGEPLPHWRANLMFDYFRFSTIQYGFKSPFSGFELRAIANYSHRTVVASLSYRLKSKNAFRHSLDGVLSYGFRNGIKIKTQVRSKIFSSKDKGGYSLGYAIAQSLAFSHPSSNSSPLTHCLLPAFEVQAAWFDAQEYDTRLYLSERNILYGFGIPMLYGKGVRGSLTATLRFSKSITLDAKYSLYHYTDTRTHISSGLQQIWGRDQHDLYLQIRIKIQKKNPVKVRRITSL